MLAKINATVVGSGPWAVKAPLESKTSVRFEFLRVPVGILGRVEV